MQSLQPIQNEMTKRQGRFRLGTTDGLLGLGLRSPPPFGSRSGVLGGEARTSAMAIDRGVLVVVKQLMVDKNHHPLARIELRATHVVSVRQHTQQQRTGID